MIQEGKAFQSAHQIGKIYHSLVDKNVLCDFFLESTVPFLHPSNGFLFLAGDRGEIWLASSMKASRELPHGLEAEAKAVLGEGKPLIKHGALFLPLIVRNAAIGVACFLREGDASFSKQDLELGFDLASQLAGALKTSLLFEENLKMERLAAVGQTISMVMHEIKNIIQIAKLGDELTRRGIRDRNEKFITHGLDGMAKAIREMDGFVWDMLSLTRDFQIEPQKVCLPSLFEELRLDLQEKADQLQIRLEVSVEESFPEVDAEGRSLYRALLNLVKNAMEASDKDDAWVSIRARSKDSASYEIEIRDNGKGMTDEAKAKLFQAFFSTKGRKGTGLGLMIVDRTLRAHGGSIAVESELGKGTFFVITLPKVIPPREG